MIFFYCWVQKARDKQCQKHEYGRGWQHISNLQSFQDLLMLNLHSIMLVTHLSDHVPFHIKRTSWPISHDEKPISTGFELFYFIFPFYSVVTAVRGESLLKKYFQIICVWDTVTIALFHYDVTSKHSIVLTLRIMVARGGQNHNNTKRKHGKIAFTRWRRKKWQQKAIKYQRKTIDTQHMWKLDNMKLKFQRERRFGWYLHCFWRFYPPL